MAAETIKEVLKKCPLFAEFDDDQVELLIHHGEIKQFAGGDTIYAKGAKSAGTFCVILSGRVGVLADSGQVVRGMGTGEVIGEIGVTSPHSKRTASVVTIAPTEVIEWKLNRIEKLVPDLKKKLKESAWKKISYYY
jgi:CRP-like cAMP-binding protein